MDLAVRRGGTGVNGSPGGNGTEYDGTHGSGGGGGAETDGGANYTGGAGGSYGAGGGGSSSTGDSADANYGGVGAPGLIVITYTPYTAPAAPARKILLLGKLKLLNGKLRVNQL